MVVDSRDYLTKVSLGEIPNRYVHVATGWRFDVPSGLFPIWQGPGSQAFEFTTGADRIGYISSSSASDTGTVLIDGLDENWDRVQMVANIGGQTKTALPSELWRVNNILANQDLVGDVYVYEDTTVTAGIPDDLSTVKGFVDPAFNRMSSSAYSVPDGHIAVLYEYAIQTQLGATGALNIHFTLKFFGGATIRSAVLPFQVNASSNSYLRLAIPSPFPPRSDLLFYTDSSIGNNFGAFGSYTMVIEKL